MGRKKANEPFKNLGGRKAGSKRPSNKPKGKNTPQRTRTTGKKDAQGQQSRNRSFPVVGIGASAGGLEALTHLLEHLPSDTGMAFVLIQHLDPKHASILTEILSRATGMPIAEVRDGMRVESNHVYVIPPNTTMTISQMVLSLTTRPKTSGPHMPIDHFLRSLAVDQKSKSIGVILSGSGSDGALGIEAIKAEGGITFVQDEKSAKHYDMPRNAISTGCVDFILSPEKIAKELARIGHHPYVIPPKPVEVEPDDLIEDENNLTKVLTSIRTTTGVDFTLYKSSTVKRRIMRRMALHRIEELGNYVKYLRNNPSEIEALQQDILIKVTNFFREPGTFEILKTQVFPSIMKNKSPGEPIRIWVPGCSTGEEVYSVAICLMEFLGDMAGNIPIQIFATDINERVLEKARTGFYIENIITDVSPERLKRFFTKVDGGYQITKAIRDVCIFAKQNLTKDPPFSNLHLISCRNVLIYLGASAQQRVVSLFHYALKPSGFLMLGNSESLGKFSDLFAPIDRRYRIYSKIVASARPAFDFASSYAMERIQTGKKTSESTWSKPDIYRESDRILLSEYVPPSIIVNDNMEIIQFRGDTAPYIKPMSGRASLSLMKMLRGELLSDLRTIVQKAKTKGGRVSKEGLSIKYNGEFRSVGIEVIPISVSSKERYFLVLFKEATGVSTSRVSRAKTEGRQPGKSKQEAKDREIAQLKQELAGTKEYLQVSVQEFEAANEELKSANEEILSSNEELQSMNEELETAKEELQSTNEELNTVNEELRSRNFELNVALSDLGNLFTSVDIPIVMVGNNLRIRRLTPMAEKLLNLIPDDIGRPISDFSLNINVPDLDELISDVIQTLDPKEQEIQDKKGNWYYMQIRPYKTIENKIDGALIILFDIDALKRTNQELQYEIAERRRAEEELKQVHSRMELILNTAGEGIYGLDINGNVTFVNPAAAEMVGWESEELMDKNWHNTIHHSKSDETPYPQEECPIHMSLKDGTIHYVSDDVFWRKDSTSFPVEYTGVPIKNEKGETMGAVVTFKDTTERRHAEESQRKGILLKEIHHRVKNNLQIISGLLNLQSGQVQDKEIVETFKETQGRIRSMALIHEQLYQSKDLKRINFNEYIENLVDYLFRSYGIDLNVIMPQISGDDVSLNIDTAVPCGLIINELVSNSLKYAFPNGRRGEVCIDISSDGDNGDSRYTLTVGDNGIGFPEGLDFRDTESLGLQLVMMLVGQIGGTIDIDRSNGTKFKITFSA